jgi:hypothetical protein
MRAPWLLLLLGTAGCLALYQRSSSDPWPCSNDGDCTDGLVCRQLDGKPFACVGRKDCLVDADCSNAATCHSGTCSCGFTQSICNGVCTDKSSDPRNCGACGNVCPGAGQTCNAGACGCPPGDTLCGNACTDTTSDPQNCSRCFATCPGYNATCVGGLCDCPTGQMRCNGTCVDVQSDSSNCGSCGNVCGTYLYCSSGYCQ